MSAQYLIDARLQTRLDDFAESSYQILFVNNSNFAFCTGGEKWLGVLHCAKIAQGDNSRVRNSTCVAPASLCPQNEVDMVRFMSDLTATSNY